MKILPVLLACFLLTDLFASAQEEERLPLVLKLAPEMTVPLGQDARYFLLGGGARIAASYWNEHFPFLSLDLGIGYTIAPIDTASHVAGASLSVVSAGVGLGAHWGLGRRLVLNASGEGGYSYGFVSQSSEAGGTPFFGAGFGASYLLSPSLGLGLLGSYRNYLELYQHAGVSAEISYYFRRRAAVPGGGPLESVRISGLSFDPIFPVFFKYYDTHPLGELILRNDEKKALEDLQVTLFVNKYMDSPKPASGPTRLEPASEAKVSLFSLFNEQVLGITTATKVAATIAVEGRMGERRFRNELTETIRLHSRNETTWEDDRRVAAFIASTDPTVLRLAKNVASLIKDQRKRGIDPGLQAAIALHVALQQLGIRYVVDPTSSYLEISSQKSVPDYLQFPSQTLDYKSGDCDDLSILNCALLEALSIETAFITIPGHIYMAFLLGAPPEEARRQFARPEDLIVIGSKAWLPVEVTSISEGFLKAWGEGIRQWREFQTAGRAALYPVREAWSTYEAVGFASQAVSIDLPPAGTLLAAYREEIDVFIRGEVEPQKARLEAAIRQHPDDPRQPNSLGILYARYELTDQAIQAFQRSLKVREYVPALVNLGNVYFLQGKMNPALQHYERARRIVGDEPKLLLALAKVHYALEQYGISQQYHAQLQKLDRELADRFAYLQGRGEAGQRAAEAAQGQEVVLWQE
jgi:tetratricopeptide (TPR) repeat protein